MGKNKQVEQASLRKRMKEHFTSKAHEQVIEQLNSQKLNVITRCVQYVNDKEVSSTCKVFRTVYSLAKRNLPFSQVVGSIELQKLNGVDLGAGLHSRQTATKIVGSIAEDIRKTAFGKIIEQNRKISIIIDKASTVSNKTALIIFLKYEDNDEYSPIIFLDLVHLPRQDAQTIYDSLLQALSVNGFNSSYLQRTLVGFCSDGASVMLGKTSLVAVKLKNDFLDIVVWHCLNHRLQLSLDDSVKQINRVNHFKTFMDKLYCIFHQSNKNQTMLFEISDELGLQITKIGRVLGPRWAACSLRAAMAVWRAYPALYNFFESDTSFSGMAARLCNQHFLQDLAVMIDILQEMSLLSTALQARNLSIAKAESLIKRSIQAFKLIKERRGSFERKVDQVIGLYENVPFKENHRFECLPREKLLDAVISNMEKRLMSGDHLVSQKNANEAFEIFNLIEPNTWNLEEVQVPWMEAEEKLVQLNKIIHHVISRNDFRDFVENVLDNMANPKLPPSIRRAKCIANTIAISSAEAERSFSLMNLICSIKRGSLDLKNISNLMVIVLIGLSIQHWDPMPHVRKWLTQHHSADDNRVKKKKTDTFTENQQAIWKLLK